MNVNVKRNIWGALALIGLASLLVHIARLAFGGDIHGWTLLLQTVATAVALAFWAQCRRAARRDDFYRRYRETYM